MLDGVFGRDKAVKIRYILECDRICVSGFSNTETINKYKNESHSIIKFKNNLYGCYFIQIKIAIVSLKINGSPMPEENNRLGSGF